MLWKNIKEGLYFLGGILCWCVGRFGIINVVIFFMVIDKFNVFIIKVLIEL